MAKPIKESTNQTITLNRPAVAAAVRDVACSAVARAQLEPPPPNPPTPPAPPPIKLFIKLQDTLFVYLWRKSYSRTPRVYENLRQAAKPGVV